MFANPVTIMNKAIQTLLLEQEFVVFAVLIGSRATANANSNSDWDIALQWDRHLDWMEILGKVESLRHDLANALKVEASQIDLIDLKRANLAMRATVAEEGLVLKGEQTLEWARFLTRTWRELEDFYWEKTHAA